MIARNCVLAGTAIAAVTAVTQPAQADLIQWSVTGDFNDGGMFSGSFTFDTVAGDVTIWSLSTSGGTSTVGSNTYSSSNSDDSSGLVLGGGINFLDLTDGGYPYGTYADLMFTDLDPGTPGGVASLTGNESVGTAYGFEPPTATRTITSGTATGTDISTVPEPASGALILAGIGVLGVYRRNHRRKM